MSACDGGPVKEMCVLSGGPEMELLWPAAGPNEELFALSVSWPEKEMFWASAGFTNVNICGPGGWPVNRGAGAIVNTGAEDWPRRPPVLGPSVTGNCGAEDGPMTSVPGCGWGGGGGGAGRPVTPQVTASCGVDDGGPVTRVAADCPVTRAAGPMSTGTELAGNVCPSKVKICGGGAGFCTGMAEVRLSVDRTESCVLEMPASPVVCWRPGTELVKL